MSKNSDPVYNFSLGVAVAGVDGASTQFFHTFGIARNESN